MQNFFSKFHKKNRRVNQLLESESPSTKAGSSPAIFPMQFIVGNGQSVGKQRDHNEDTLFTFSSVLSDGKSEELFGLFIIADGMGGHRNGEIASSVAIRVVVKYILDQLYKVLLAPQHVSPAVGIQEILNGAVNDAQRAVLQHAPGGGTTLTIALILGEQLTISHVGDSRAYFVLPDGKLQQITRDHSLVQRLVELKEISIEEAHNHPQKNVLLKAVGQPEPFHSDIKTTKMPSGYRLMLCSDGLWGVVPAEKMKTILAAEKDPVQASRLMVEEANHAGGPDNISVILVSIAGDNNPAGNP